MLILQFAAPAPATTATDHRRATHYGRRAAGRGGNRGGNLTYIKSPIYCEHGPSAAGSASRSCRCLAAEAGWAPGGTRHGRGRTGRGKWTVSGDGRASPQAIGGRRDRRVHTAPSLC